MKCNAIAYYGTDYEEIGKLIIDTTGKSIDDIWEIGYKNECHFPQGQLLKIELLWKID